MSCASWMGRTLLFRVASGTKLMGVSSKHDVKQCSEAHILLPLLNHYRSYRQISTIGRGGR